MPSPRLTAASKSTRTEAEIRAARSYRIRRCDGNRAAWCLSVLRADGTEIDSYGGYKTAFSIDSLLGDSRSPSPQPGDKLEILL